MHVKLIRLLILFCTSKRNVSTIMVSNMNKCWLLGLMIHFNVDNETEVYKELKVLYVKP